MLRDAGLQENSVRLPDANALTGIEQVVFKKFPPRTNIPAPPRAHKAKPFYGITRVEDATDGSDDAWVVHLKRRGKTFIERFSDAKYGSKRKALTIARAWRDREIAAHR